MIHTLGTLSLTPQDLKSVSDVVKSNWLSPGKTVTKFEKAFAKAHSQNHAVMVNSGTDALRIALAALKEKHQWKDGTEVYVPAITFVATVNVVLQLNLKPMLVDVSMYDFNINPDNLLWRFKQTNNMDGKGPWKKQKPLPMSGKCVIPVHLAGKACNMKKIMQIAKENNLAVLEDSCEAMGIQGICKGDVTAFSFYVAHLITTGVGGMATTNDKELSKLMWSYSNHGRREPKKFAFDRLGYSCRPTEFEAALGLNQLPDLSELLKKRRRIAYLLYIKMHHHKTLTMNFCHESANMFFPILIKENASYKKQKLMEHLGKKGVETRDLMPIIGQPCYKGLWDESKGFCSVARTVNDRGFYIGSHQGMTESDTDEIADAFDSFLWGKEG